MAPHVPKIRLKAIDVFHCHVQQLLTRVQESFGPCWHVTWVWRKMQVVPCYSSTSLWDPIELRNLDSCPSWGSRPTDGSRRGRWPHPEMIQKLHDPSRLKREKENNINVSFLFRITVLQKTFLCCHFNLTFRKCFFEEMQALEITALNILLTAQKTFFNTSINVLMLKERWKDLKDITVSYKDADGIIWGWDFHPLK